MITTPSVDFTPMFNFCIDNFFPESDRKNRIIGELMRSVMRPTELPEPAECGTHKIRKKILLPDSNVVAYYWDYGRVWAFFGIVESNNAHQMKELFTHMLNEKNNHSD